MERLAADARSEDPDILIATIERLEAVREKVEMEYSQAWRRTRSEINFSYSPRFAELSDQESEIWETDEEFNSRIRQERTRRINTAQGEMETQEEEQTAEIRSQLEDALSTLRRSTWMLKGSDVELEVGEYDRNARQWPFTVSSTVDWLPVQDFRVVAYFSRMSDSREAIIELNDAVQAGALAGEITWKIERDEENDRYLVVAYSVRGRNIVSDRLIESEYPRQSVSAFTAAERVAEANSIVGTVRISLSGFSGPVAIKVDGEEITTAEMDSRTPAVRIREGEHLLSCKPKSPLPTTIAMPAQPEWEYAARGGQEARDTTYAGSNDAGDVAWYDRNSNGRTQPVGGKQANELGLHDMSGNVWEWCWDRYDYDDDYYDDSPRSNPVGPRSGSYRMMRGGASYAYARRSRVATPATPATRTTATGSGLFAMEFTGSRRGTAA